MSVGKRMTKYKLLSEAVSIIAEDVHQNVRDPGPHDDAQAEYLDERLMIAASDFLDEWREPRKPTKEQEVLENLTAILEDSGSTDRFERMRVRLANRLHEIKMEDVEKIAEDQKRKVQEQNMARSNFLRELARSFGAHGSGNNTFEHESEDFALFAMEITKRIERRAFKRVAEFFKNTEGELPAMILTPARVAAHIDMHFIDNAKEQQ